MGSVTISLANGSGRQCCYRDCIGYYPLPSPLLGACFAVSSCGHEHACELWSTEKDDPMLAATALWAQTHPALAQPASAINGAIDGRSIFDADPRLRAPNLHAP